MSFGAGLAIYVIIWWLTLFAVLPFGVVTHFDEDSVERGTAPSAPLAPRMWRKALITTGVSAIIFVGVYWLIAESGLSLDDVPFLPKFGETY
ncbi:MAG: DUF1467 family protein [Parvibaculum sp.]